MSFLPKLKIEVVVPSNEVEKAVNAIRASAKTGQIGDGKIFVTPVEHTLRIRTGEADDDALSINSPARASKGRGVHTYDVRSPTALRGPPRLAAALCLMAAPAFAAPTVNKGDVAFMFTSTVLVLLMTIPGLAPSTAAWCGRRTCWPC